MLARNRCFVVWVNEEGKTAAIHYELIDFRLWLAHHPECYQYHIVDETWLYHLATTDDRLKGLEHEQVLELIMYIEVPF